MIVQALEQAGKFKKIAVPAPGKKDLELIIGLIDYTTLNDTDNSASVTAWVKESAGWMEETGLPFGGWCTYSEFAPLVRSLRGSHAPKIAVVSGNFPTGKAPVEIKISESAMAERAGAEEIDVVINKGWAVAGRYDDIEDEIAAVKQGLKKARLKVIMETGLLSPDKVRIISGRAIRAGADFIKTSTGKIPQGASLDAVAVMCHVIKEHYENTGIKTGIKPSGGISTPEEAMRYLMLIDDILGSGWLTSQYCRIGASRLLKNAIAAL